MRPIPCGCHRRAQSDQEGRFYKGQGAVQAHCLNCSMGAPFVLLHVRADLHCCTTLSPLRSPLHTLAPCWFWRMVKNLYQNVKECCWSTVKRRGFRTTLKYFWCNETRSHTEQAEHGMIESEFFPIRGYEWGQDLRVASCFVRLEGDPAILQDAGSSAESPHLI